MPTTLSAATASPQTPARAEPLRSDRLNLRDALVLVGLLAPALSLVRGIVASNGLPLLQWTPEGLLLVLTQGTLYTAPLMLMLMLALVILRRLRPEASWRTLGREPGLTACLAAGLGLGVAALMVAPLALLEPWRSALLSGRLPWPGGRALIWWLAVVLPLLGSAVGSAWMALYLNGQWRPRPTWIDRAGRLCGAYWLVATVIVGAGLLQSV